MALLGRPGLSAGKKDDLWARFKAGESFTAIGRALGKPVGSIYGVVRLQGGIAPPVRRRAVRALSSGEREAISRGDFARPVRRSVRARDGAIPGAGTVDDQSRDYPECGTGPVSSPRRGRTRVAAREAPEALPAGS